MKTYRDFVCGIDKKGNDVHTMIPKFQDWTENEKIELLRENMNYIIDAELDRMLKSRQDVGDSVSFSLDRRFGQMIPKSEFKEDSIKDELRGFIEQETVRFW